MSMLTETYHLLYFVYDRKYNEVVQDRNSWREGASIKYGVHQSFRFVDHSFSSLNQCKAHSLRVIVKTSNILRLHLFFDAIAVYKFDGERYTPVSFRTRTDYYDWRKWVNHDVESKLSIIMSDEIRQEMDNIEKRSIRE